MAFPVSLFRDSNFANLIEDQIFIKDLEHKYIFCNNSFANYAQINADNIIGLTDYDIVGKDKAEFYIEKDLQVLKSGKTINYQSIYHYEDGRQVHYETKKSPCLDENGKIIGVIGISRDITPILKDEMKYKANYARLETLIKNLNSGILVENEKRQILVINNKFLEMFKIPLTISEMIGADCSNAAQDSKHLIANPEEFVIRIEELLFQRKLTVGDIIEFADGRYMRRDFIPVYNDGVFHGQMWVYTDISSQIRHEQEREEYINQLSESNQRISRDAQRLALLTEALGNSKETLQRLSLDLDSILD